MRELTNVDLHPESRRQLIIETYVDRFGQQPEWGARAPGRVDLMGSHTDYNEGYVLTLPIDRDTWIFAGPSEDLQVSVYSLNVDSSCTFSLDSPTKVDGWGRYVQAVLEQLRKADFALAGFNAVVHSTVPLGSGLSSSASLEAATATLAEQIGAFTIGKLEKTKLCQRAENVGVGVSCGILDQYSSIFGETGKAIVLDCRSLTHETAPIPLELRPVICDTKSPRQLIGSEYSGRRMQCEEGAAYFAALDSNVKTLRDVTSRLFHDHQSRLTDDVRKRSQFIIEEHARVLQLARALAADDRDAINKIMSQSYTGARDLFEISVKEMESMYESMTAAPGIVGCRQAGAGLGGCMIAIVEAANLDAFITSVKSEYEKKTGLQPDIYPVQAFAGAGNIDIKTK